MRMDGRIDKHDKGNSRLSQFRLSPKMTWTCRNNIRIYNGVVFAGKPDDTRKVRFEREREGNIKKYLREIDCILFSKFSCSG
jgi:hypothetical protein